MPKKVKTNTSIKVSESSGTIERMFSSQSQNGNPFENIPHRISKLGMTIPGTACIPAQRSSSFDNPGRFIPRAMDKPAAGSADRPHYSEHPA
eukprot:14068723-Heterocapsa_arctica.AAC.1